MLLRKVFKLSSSLRNLSVSPQFASAYHLSHVEQLKGPKNVQADFVEDNNDKLSSDLKSSSLSRVLILLESNKKTLQGSHIVTAMAKFYHSMKRESLVGSDDSEPMNLGLAEHTFYQEMFQTIQSNLNKLSGSQAVQVLYYLTKMKSISNSIENSLLRHIFKNLNSLTLEEFRLLSSLLKKSSRRESVPKMQYAIIKNFIKRISMDHQKDNIDYLADGLYVLSCTSSLATAKLLDLFVKDLNEYKNDIPLDKALLIYESLSAMYYLPKGWVELLKRIETYITEGIDELYTVQVNNIIYAITYQTRNDKREFYNPKFVDLLVQKVINSDQGFTSALSALRCLNDLKHSNKELLNYVCASYFETIALKNIQISHHSGKLLVILAGLANANHKTIFWNEVENYITTEQSFLNYDHKTLCVAALNATCLGCYPTKILEKVFDGTYNYSESNFMHWTFCKVYQKVKTNPSYNGPFPSEVQLKSINKLFMKTIKKRTFPLLPHVEEGMGSPTCVKTSLGTKLFHIIDHAVAFDTDNLPIPLNVKTNTESFEYVEDLEVPPNSKIVLIATTPEGWYYRNTKELIGPFSVFIDTLEKMNYLVVAINEADWAKIPDGEKTSFLMSKIESKLNSSSIS